MCKNMPINLSFLVKQVKHYFKKNSFGVKKHKDNH
jgi:hypothetical protein